MDAASLGMQGIGEPALVCRWRLAGGRLPMAGRHLRALRARELDGRPLPPTLIAWAKEHVDWTLGHGSMEYPDGVLMLVIDRELRAAMAAGPYEPLGMTTMRALVQRAKAARRESSATRVAPETMWLVRGGRLEWLDEGTNVASGAATLVCDLAQTVGIAVVRLGDLPSYAKGDGSYEGAFLVSDEHGVVLPSDRKSTLAQRFADGYERLLKETMRRRASRERKEG